MESTRIRLHVIILLYRLNLNNEEHSAFTMASNGDDDKKEEEMPNVSLEGEAAAITGASAAAVTTNNTAAERVASYILETSVVQFNHGVEKKSGWTRIKCPSCNASRYLYCPDCCIILIPRNDWPTCIAHGTLRLPFKLDIILDDKRINASGVQVVTILRAAATAAAAARGGGDKMLSSDDNDGCCCRLFDQALNDDIPNYAQQEEGGGTYFLFPDETSVPLSLVISSSSAITTANYYPILRKLVVLDCKWSSSSIRLHPHLSCLKKVHLDNPPETSYFWRWHSAGKGMLSTVEAIYYAASQVAASSNWNSYDQEQLVHLLWLFGLQRQVISRRFLENKDKQSCSTLSGHDTTQQPATTNTNSGGGGETTITNATSSISISNNLAYQKSLHLPFTENAKEIARALRKLQQKNRKK